MDHRRQGATSLPRTTRRSFLPVALIVRLLTGLLPAATLAQGPDGLPVGAITALELTSNVSPSFLGRYAGVGAEILAYTPGTKRLFITGPPLQFLDIANPISPTLVMTVSIEATSVAIKNGIISTAVPTNPVQGLG